MLCAPLPSKRPKTAQKLLQIARCISALKIALNCTKILLTRRFFACSFAFFRVVALLSVYVITNIFSYNAFEELRVIRPFHNVHSFTQLATLVSDPVKVRSAFFIKASPRHCIVAGRAPVPIGYHFFAKMKCSVSMLVYSAVYKTKVRHFACLQLCV